MGKVLINDQYLTDIAEAIRAKNATDTTYKPREMAAAIGELDVNLPVTPVTPTPVEAKEWERPEGWQNLDAVDVSDFEGLYATYLVQEGVKNFLSIYGGSLTIEEVTIGEDGTVTVVQTMEPDIADNVARLCLNELSAGVHTFRVTGFDSGFAFYTSYALEDASVLDSERQYCVEYVARQPGMTLPLSTTSCKHATLYTERAVVYDCDFAGTSNSSMITNTTGGFAGAVTLQELILHGITMPSSMQGMFVNLFALANLVFDDCDFSKVTTLQYTFQNCTSLTTLDVSGWDTSNVTTLYYTFQNCTSLTTLDVSGWDTVSVTNVSSWLSDARNLIWLTFGKFYLSISISASSRYHRETLAAILVALPEVTSSKTITMGSTNKAKLTEAEIAVATAKGWTVA